jgi:hypothetical protein
MLAPFKLMLNEYKSFVIRMFDDLATNLVVATNYEPLCDVKILMGLTYIYVANVGGNTSLRKLAQNKECFICDFVIMLKPIQAHLYILYVNPKLQFSHD